MEEKTVGHVADKPLLINVYDTTYSNDFYRKEIWTGDNAQVTVMSIPQGGEIGLEQHENFDQILKIEYGVGSVYFGESKQSVKFIGNANSEYAVFIPAGTWHNVINERNVPLKLFSVYAPPHHPKGTVHKTKFDSDLSDY